jgi:hypothetical protein
MALHPATSCLLDQVLDLCIADCNFGQQLPAEDDLCRSRVLCFARLCQHRGGVILKALGGLDGLDALLKDHRYICREGDCDAVKEVLPQLAFFWVKRRNQQGAARMGDGETFTLDDVDAIRQN